MLFRLAASCLHEMRKMSAGGERAAQWLLAHKGVTFLLCLVIASLSSFSLRQDANWDLKNYHLYGPYALLEGRFDIDFQPAGLQNFLNPLVDVPYYWLAVVLLPSHPRLVMTIQGLYYGVILCFALIINQRVFANRTSFPGLTAVIATAIGATGAVTFATVGLAHTDIQPSVLVLAGIILALPARSADGKTDSTRGRMNMLLAGLAFGAAAGLKLTAVIYAPAAVLAIAATQRSVRLALSEIALFCAGWGAGFLILFGYWGWRMFEMTGNPVFPFFNSIFQSNWYPPTDFSDGRFFPKKFRIAIFYPFKWAFRSQWIVIEGRFGDARFAAAWLGLLLLGGVWLRALVKRSSTQIEALRKTSSASAEAGFVIVFVLASYVIWLSLFSIIRYAIPIEILTGTIILLAIEILALFIFVPRRRPQLTVMLSMVILLALVVAKQTPKFGRVPFAEHTFSIEFPQIPQGSQVIVAGAPMTYVIPFAKSDGTSFIGITHTMIEARGFRLFDEARRRITTHPGSLFILANQASGGLRPVIAELGATWRDDACVPIRSNLDRDLKLCRANRVQ